MKKILAILLAVIILIPSGISAHAEGVDNTTDLFTLQELISEGNSITDYSSSEAYVWVTKVSNFNEKYTASYVYSDIKSECNLAKRYTSISTFNCANKIIGYLLNLEDYINENDTKSVSDLMEYGKTIDDYASVDAYKWLVDVLNTNEKYKTSFVYGDIKNECNSAKRYTSTSTFNCANKILGYLSVVQDEIDRADGQTVRELIVSGNALSDKASADAYKWIIDVLKTNDNFLTSSVYSDIKSKCNSAKGYTSISTFNVDSQILADLTLLDNEIPVSTELLGISITKQPTKVIYTEGDTFSATGMVVLATYLNTYKDNSTDTEEKVVTNFTVDKMTPLIYDDTFVTISYEENGVTKTATQNITVNPIIESKSLKSISIVTPPTKTVYKEGETFSKVGMKVNATYEQMWSDGSQDIGEYENVSYTVDTTTPLSAQDNSITISFEDGGITKTTQQGIIVESYIVSTTLDSIVIASNPTKLTYIEGEKFDKTGLSVDAKFLNKWSNGYEEYTTEKNVAYSVNTTSPLSVSNTSWTVSYIVDGVKKEENISIVVSPKADDNRDNDDTNPTLEKVKIPTVSKVSSLKVTAGKKKLTMLWKKDSSVAGYQIQISTKLNFKGAKIIDIAKSKKTYTKKSLKSKKKYYVRIRAYKTYKDNGMTKKVYGKWVVKNKKTK